LETLHEKTLTPAIIAPMLDVGRKTRSIPPAIRRALNARDPGCCFPGCTYQRYLDAHHVEHWADGGETKLKNLVHLCRTHHRLVHEGGIAVKARAGGGWRFSRPDGREFDIPYREAATAQDWTALRDTHAALGIEIDSDTAATRWRGERMNKRVLTGMPSVSPDGKWIAFAGQENKGQKYDQSRNSLWLVDEGGATHLVEAKPGQGRAPSWSPSGEQLAFESTRGSTAGLYALFVINRDGTGLVQVTDRAVNADHPVWSPDGRQLAFSAHDATHWSGRSIGVIEVQNNR
jgi:WD40-like Beta Propeller Repeat